MNETLHYLRTFAAFPLALRRFAARPPLTLPEAQRIVRERLTQREANFLYLVERGVFGWPRSPYLPLLKQAGCELGDIRALVQSEGLEGALGKLREAGVYVTFEELKGRKPIRRGSLEYHAANRAFDNPLARRDMVAYTGGSTGAAHSVGVDLDNIVARSAQRLLVQAAHGVLGAPYAIWQGMLPAPGLRKMLFGHYMGNVPQRWFSPFGGRESRQWLKYYLGTYYLIMWLRLAGIRVPSPEIVPVDRAVEIARWVAETVKTHGRCLIHTGVSKGVRLGLAAQAAGLDLTGATITGAGEPPTPAKVEQMTRAGAHYYPGYSMTEAGQIGSGCIRPADTTDVHLFKDSVALITHPHFVEGSGQTVPAFNLTTLLSTASTILINVQMDDFGIVEERSCGCELESYGFTTHLRQIYSYGKLTGEGVTLIGTEMVRVLDEVLPARFGGNPLDYQLVEEEDGHGLTRLYLAVHPRLENIDEPAVVACLLDSLSRSSAMANVASMHWQSAGSIQVRRVEPVWTGRGKLLHLHVPHRTQASMPRGSE